jgi:hypothetical protein
VGHVCKRCDNTQKCERFRAVQIPSAGGRPFPPEGAGRPTLTLAPQGFGVANPTAPHARMAGRARNACVTIVLSVS